MFEPLVAHELGLELIHYPPIHYRSHSLSHSFVVVGLELACSLTNGREMLPSWISNDAVGNQLHMDDGLIINELFAIGTRRGVASWFDQVQNTHNLAQRISSTAPRTRIWKRIFTFV